MSVTVPRRLAERMGSQASGHESSSRAYRRRNASHFFGSWSNHLRNSVVGPTSLSQAAIWSFARERPRGHRRSTRNRRPSVLEIGSYARLSLIIAAVLPEGHTLHDCDRRPQTSLNGRNGSLSTERHCP